MSGQTLPGIGGHKSDAAAASPSPGGAVELPSINTSNATPVPDEMPPTPRRRDVETMPSFEIMDHLRRRNCVPTGFYEDDKLKLQALFDDDYEQQKATRQAYLAAVNANRKDNYTREFAERKKRRDEMEVNTALKNTPQVPRWLELVKSGECNAFACWNGIRKPLVRYVATQLPVQSRLVGLELCRCHINDEICDLLADMLRSNRSLRQLNIGENAIGSNGLRALARSLEVNDVLKFLGLQGNPLLRRDGGETSHEGVSALADMVAVNSSLIRLNVLNTGLGARACKLLGEALTQNEQMLIVEMDMQPESPQQAQTVLHVLQRNQHMEKVELERQKQARLEEKKQELEEQQALEEAAEQQRQLDWIEDQRRQRIQDRKRLKEEEREAARIAEERRKEIARAKMQLALAATKGKKKKGKKKKKK